MAPDDSVAFRSLQKAMQNLQFQQLDLKILLYDNTPGRAYTGSLPEGVRYEWAGRNMGLATAYNWALEIAALLESGWLLLLDQDTALPPDFIAVVTALTMEYEANAAVVALVPIARSGGVVVSPKRVGFFSNPALRKHEPGIQDAEITAINSGAVLRCDFVRSIGGFSGAYWLDYLDFWFFRQIYGAGKKVAISECIIEHSLSIQDYRKNISLARYSSILAGESKFMVAYKAKSQLAFYLFRLFVRSARFAIWRQPKMAMITLATIARIVRGPTSSTEGEPV